VTQIVALARSGKMIEAMLQYRQLACASIKDARAAVMGL